MIRRTWGPRAWLLPMAWLGCGGELPLSEVALPSCLVVTPETVDFQPVDLTAAPKPPEERRIRLTNPVSPECRSTLQLRGYTLTGDDAFSVGGVGDIRLDAGQSTYVPVRFTPVRPGDFQGSVQVRVVEESQPREIPLRGRALGPVIDVDLDAVDFGSPYVGCGEARTVRITNRGNAPLVVSDLRTLSASPPEFSLGVDELGPLPWTLAPYNPDHGEPSASVAVVYRPLDAWRDEGTLAVTSNDPVRPTFFGTLSGTGALMEERVDTFVQDVPGQVDILFALSRSGRMDDDLDRTLRNVDDLLHALSKLEAPYRAAVTVADGGCIVGDTPYIDHTFSASQAKAAVRAMADVYFTSTGYGSNAERPWMLLEAALSPKNIGPGGCNEAFYREDAELALVTLSDGTSGVGSWSRYLRMFQDLKANPEDLTLSAISGDYPSGCPTARPFEDGYAAAAASGGVYASICRDDWWRDLKTLTEPKDLGRSFRLSTPPLPSSIEVSVDGLGVTRGWSYDASTTSVVFDLPSAPPPAARIEVRYNRLPDCAP